jgi:hypothetical protein
MRNAADGSKRRMNVRDASVKSRSATSVKRRSGAGVTKRSGVSQ